LDLEKKIDIVVNLTRLSSIPAGLVGLLLAGLYLVYKQEPKLEAWVVIAGVIIPVAFPVILIWMLRVERISSRALRLFLSFILLIYGGVAAVYFGRGLLNDFDDFIIWFPPVLYGVLIVMSACLFLKRDFS